MKNPRRNPFRTLGPSAGVVAAVVVSLLGGCSKPPPPPPPPPPPAAPPPPALINFADLSQELKADARVQFSENLNLTEDQRPLAEAIVKLASAVAKGDANALRPMLTRRAQDVLSELESTEQ